MQLSAAVLCISAWQYVHKIVYSSMHCGSTMSQHKSPMRHGRHCKHAALSAAAHASPGSASCTALQTLRQNLDGSSGTEGSGGFQHRTTGAMPQLLSQHGAIVTLVHMMT